MCIKLSSLFFIRKVYLRAGRPPAVFNDNSWSSMGKMKQKSEQKKKKTELTLYIKQTKKQLFTFPLTSEPLIEHKAPCPRKTREKGERETEKRRERERKMCYVTLGSANLLIMLLMFLSENFYGCFCLERSAE